MITILIRINPFETFTYRVHFPGQDCIAHFLHMSEDAIENRSHGLPMVIAKTT